MDFSALSDFDLVASHGGFGRASRASGRSKATLSRRVAGLEARLGVRLIERGAHGLRLTDEGTTLHASMGGHFAEIRAAADAVGRRDGRLSGQLRISSAVLFAHAHLGRICARFSMDHPDVALDVVADDRLVDAVDEEFDLVIRANPPPDDRLVGRRFLRTPRVVVAAPGMPRPREGGEVRTVERGGGPSEAVWRLGDEQSALKLRPRPALRLSSLMMVRDAVLTGAGAALLPHRMVAEDVATGRLVKWGILDGAPTELWALHTSRRFVNGKVRAFVGYLEDAFPERSGG